MITMLLRIKKHACLPLVAAMLLAWVACENDPQEVAQLSDNSNKTAVETIKDVSILYSEQAHVKVQLTAPQLYRYKTDTPYVEFPKGITITFFDDSLRTTGTLTADYAIRREKEQKTTLRNNVQWKNALKNERLDTEELDWNEQTRRVTSDKFVRITTNTESITGQGFEADQNFSHYKIRKITGTFRVKSDAM